jgi:transcriptional regulator with XRE-family HTH domain
MTRKGNPLTAMRFGHISAILRSAMKTNDWSTKELAERIGVTGVNPSATVSNWIRGVGPPSGKNRKKLAALLHVPEEELLPRDPNTKPPPPSPNSSFERESNVIRKAHGNSKATDQALQFSINKDGTARIAIDRTTSRQRGIKLLQMLLEAGFGEEEES